MYIVVTVHMYLDFLLKSQTLHTRTNKTNKTNETTSIHCSIIMVECAWDTKCVSLCFLGVGWVGPVIPLSKWSYHIPKGRRYNTGMAHHTLCTKSVNQILQVCCLRKGETTSGGFTVLKRECLCLFFFFFFFWHKHCTVL